MASPRRRANLLIAVLFVGAGLAIGFLLAPKESGLAAGLPDNPDQMAQVWNERLQAAFPAGTPLTTLEGHLQASKFTLRDDQQSATRGRSDLFKGCGSILLVQWDVDGDRAENVRGTVLTC
jgi:hypothetical protein